MNAWYRLYDYPNAFAFHNPVAPRKTLETADAEVIAAWRFNRHYRLEFEVDYRDSVSNDSRIEYDRTRYSLSFVWEM